MRSRCNADTKASPTPSQESLVSQHSAEEAAALAAAALAALGGGGGDGDAAGDPRAPFVERPFCVYSAHTSDLLDVAWSKNYFILSSSMDKTVRLWHISRRECLCCFQHIDFVTAIAFHPRVSRLLPSSIALRSFRNVATIESHVLTTRFWFLFRESKPIISKRNSNSRLNSRSD